MPATQSRSDSSVSANFIQQFDQAKEQAKSVFAAQKELLDALEQINEHWFARAKSEAELATAMANKLARIAWAVLSSGNEYRPVASTPA